MNQDLQQLLMDAFRIESKERIESMFSNLDALEKSSGAENKARLIEVVYRESHSLKGAARSVNIDSVEALCQIMENLFSAVKEGKTDFSPELFDLLHRAVAAIDAFLAGEDPDSSNLSVVAEQLERALAVTSSCTPGPAPEQEVPKTPDDGAIPASARDETPQSRSPSKPSAMDTVRIKTAKLDRLLMKTEELIPIKQMLIQHQEQLKQIRDTLRTWMKKSGQMPPVMAGITDLTSAIEQNNRLFGALIDDFLEEVKQTALLPFESLFTVLPRMVRDISRSLGKIVDIEFSGQNIEIDKRILEIMKDPFIHLVRNAVDHGIEPPEDRMRAGKPERAVIRIHVFQNPGNSVEISVADDGRGLEIPKIKQMAAQKGIISIEQAHAMDDAEAAMLIFHSGMSTSSIITDLSGRGLGMAIVKEKIEEIGGRIKIQNMPGRGVIFRIFLPIALATFRGTLVYASGHYFVIPTAHVVHILSIEPEDVRSAKNRAMIIFKDKPVSLADLAETLNLPRDIEHPAKALSKKNAKPALILSAGVDDMAVIVDAVINEQEVLVKNLGKQIRRVPNVSGATILGTGRVVPVINVAALIRTAAEGAVSARIAQSLAPASGMEPKSILIVEDSFTSRTLLKNILEATGYHVHTAIDGIDGFEQLKARPFDAVVSDIEMPRMDGIALTRQIRSAGELASLPVILVTSLDARQDRERGMEAGADAYIIKSSFDQSNLLEVLERLV